MFTPELAVSDPSTVKTPAILNAELLAITDPVVAAMVTSLAAENPAPEVSAPFTVITPPTLKDEPVVVSDPVVAAIERVEEAVKPALAFKVPPTVIAPVAVKEDELVVSVTVLGTFSVPPRVKGILLVMLALPAKSKLKNPVLVGVPVVVILVPEPLMVSVPEVRPMVPLLVMTPLTLKSTPPKKDFPLFT
jgi:hypothetical protein